MNNLSFLFVFFLNPFIATIRALRTLNDKAIILSVTLFMGFFGTTTYYYGDNQRYRDFFFILHQQVSSGKIFTSNFYDGETTFDIAVPLISYVVSFFTGNEKILFAVFGLIFGYFFSKNIVFALQVSNYKTSKSKIALFFIIIFSFIYPFWTGTNSVRYVVANSIFFYFLFQYFISDKKKNLFYLFFSFLFHFSFIVPTIVVVIYFLLNFKKRVKLLFLLFVASFFLIEIAFEPLKNIVTNYAPSFLTTKVVGYTSDSYIQSVDELDASRSWHAMYYKKILHFTIVVLVFYVYRFRKSISNNLLFEKLFPFTLFYFSCANLLSVIPDFDRFLQIAYMISICCILIFLSYNPKHKIFKISILPLTFWLVVVIRAGFDFVTVGTIISNPILAFFGFLDDVNLITFIK